MNCRGKARGFAIVELILALVVVLIMFVGIAFVVSNSDSSVDAPVEDEVDEGASVDSGPKILNISDFDLQLEVPEGLEGLHLQLQSSFLANVSSVEFDTTSYRIAIGESEGVVSLCGPGGQGALGSLIRVPPNTTYPGGGFATYENFANSTTRPSKRIGKFLYIYDPTTVCSSFYSPDEVSLLRNAIKETLQAVPSAETEE